MSYNKKFATQPKKQMTTQQRKAKLAQNYYQKFGKPYPSKMNSTNQQAFRTGGWANPSKGGELKFCDVSTSLSIPSASAAFSSGVLLLAIPNGTDASGRIGRKITIKSLLLRWSFQLQSTSISGGNLRVLVVYDKQANATAPAITDILLTDNFHSQNNLSNRDRFVTIFDSLTENISVQGNYATCANNFKALNLEAIYNAGTDALIGSIASGSIYIFAAQSGAIGTAAPIFNYRSRIRYTDV